MTSRSCRWVEAALVWLLFFAAGAGLLWVGGAFQGELGFHPDEPAHYVTGLMLRDYIASSAPSPPMRYAENYYLHYPKVALGHYPPFFYVVEAAWMLLFPVSRASILLLLVALTALTTSLLYFVVRKEFGRLAGIAAGGLLIAIPLIQFLGSMVMAEALMVPLVFGAAICYGRYLETGRWTYSTGFGILAALAILTKQVGLFLALLPLIALLLSRQVRLLWRLSFWLPAGIVAALVLPWYAYVHTHFPTTIPSLAGVAFPRPSAGDQVAQLVWVNGVGILLAASVGVWVRVIWPALRGRPVEGRWACLAALVGGFLLFRRMAPAAYELRHLVYVEPSLLVFAAAGIGWLAARLTVVRVSLPARAVSLALITVLAFGVQTFQVPAARYVGFSEAARYLLENPEFRDDAILICSDASGEGAFIGELAMRETRPGHIVLRGNNMLAQSNWNGGAYSVLYATPEDVEEYLESVSARVLVVGGFTGWPQRQHERLVQQMLERYPERWRLAGTYPTRRAPSTPGVEVRLYRFAGAGSGPTRKIRIDLNRRLGRFIEN